MVPPKKVTPEQFESDVDTYIQCCCDVVDGKLVCKTCRALIQGVTVYVSLHSELFEICAGWGDVLYVSIPSCPACEQIAEQDKYSCVHVPHGMRDTEVTLQRLEGRDPLQLPSTPRLLN